MSQVDDVFAQIFGEKLSTQNVTPQVQNTPQFNQQPVNVSPFDFSQIQEFPSTDGMIESNDDESEDNVQPFQFNIPGMSQAQTLSPDLFQQQLVTPPKRGRGRPPKDKSLETVQNSIANVFNSPIAEDDKSKSIAGYSQVTNGLPVQEGQEVTIRISAQALLQIGEAWETIGRAIKVIATQKLQSK